MPEIETALTAELFGEISAGIYTFRSAAAEFDVNKVSGLTTYFQARAEAKKQTGRLSAWFGKGKQHEAERAEAVNREAQQVHTQLDEMVDRVNGEARRLASRMFSGLPASAGREIDFGGRRFREAVQGGMKPDEVRATLQICTVEEAAALFEIESDRKAFMGLITLEQQARELNGHTDATPVEKIQLAMTACMRVINASEIFAKATIFAPPVEAAPENPPPSEPVPETPSGEKPFKAVFRTGGSASPPA